MIDRESSEFGRGIASIWVHRLHRVAERIWKKSTAWRIVRTRFSGSWAYGFRFAGWIWSGIALWCGFYRQRSRKSENLALLYVECQKIGGKVMDFLDFQTKSSEISFFSVFLRVKAGFFDRRARCRRFHSISAPGIGFCPQMFTKNPTHKPRTSRNRRLNRIWNLTSYQIFYYFERFGGIHPSWS